MIREIIDEELQKYVAEYSEKQKQDMGVPKGAKGRGGKWYMNGKYIGKTEDGKFVKVDQRSPEAQRERNKPKDPLAGPYYVPGDSSGEYEKGMASPAQVKLVDKIQDMFADANFEDLGGVNIDVAFDEFQKRTGITRKAANWYTKHHGDAWEYDFAYDPEKDSVYIPDPMDV